VAEVSFEPRYSLPWMRNPGLELLRNIFLHPKGPGWYFGEALIRYEEGGEEFALIVLARLSNKDPQKIPKISCNRFGLELQ
jgi:hypothetical protein